MLLEYKFGKYYKDGVEIEKAEYVTFVEGLRNSHTITDELPEIEEDPTPDTPVEPVKKTTLPTDIPTLYFDGLLPHTKDEGNFKGACHYRSSAFNIDCYATLKVQGNSSTAYNKKNFTITFYSDKACTTKQKINFGWGAQSKYVMKANWIDITHSRNVVSAQLWGDVVKSRDDYEQLPELLRTSPNQGAIDGFPIKFYGDNVYWGRYSMNIPKDAWMTNMDKTNPEHLILCGENYNEALFRAPAVWDETDWTDELHSEVPAELLARFNELVSFIMNSTDEEFKSNLSSYVDLQSVLDYYVFGLLICNLDGFGKNHIWLSYDGNKFIASAYDMDSTFGLYWDGSQMLPATYGRTSFEDMVNGRLGNLLYLRLVDMFAAELSASYTRLVQGPMSFVNVLERFEKFIGIAPASLVAEDYAATTGNGACTGIPSVDTNNIQQIRQWYATRLSFVKAALGVIDEEDDVELPEPFAIWENQMFDGDATKKTPINTGYQLFSDDPEWQVWTLQFHAKLNPGTSGQRAAIHCMDETGSPWPGMVMQVQGGGDINGTITEIRMTKTSSGQIEGITFNTGAEQYVALQRNGSVVKYCIDGKNWNTFPGTLYEHTAPLVIGGFCNGNGQVLGGADGREINGIVTARLWKENLDNVAKLFIEQFPENLYDFDHTMNMMSYDQLNGMQAGQSVEAVMVNPNKTSGYILGYNNGVLGAVGTAELQATKILIDQNATDDYKMIISKVAETRTEQQLQPVAKTFGVSGSFTANTTGNFARYTAASINGYDLYGCSTTRLSLNNTTARSGSVTVTFDGSTFPRTIYFYIYGSSTSSVTASVATGGTTVRNTISTTQTPTSISSFTAYNMTSNSVTFNLSAQRRGNTTRYVNFIIAVPNTITEDELVDVQVPTENTYYTIKSKVGGYGPTGNVDDQATWSTTLKKFQVANATSITDPESITTNINTDNNPCMIRFVSEDDSFLNAGGAANSIKFATGQGTWSVWNLWLIDSAMPRIQSEGFEESEI
ncbi:MAG: CotH kinase family protein [Bacillota bacterium]|nr:CotH kinase family protein [Bacillota bacterium]